MFSLSTAERKLRVRTSSTRRQEGEERFEKQAARSCWQVSAGVFLGMYLPSQRSYSCCVLASVWTTHLLLACSKALAATCQCGRKAKTFICKGERPTGSQLQQLVLSRVTSIL